MAIEYARVNQKLNKIPQIWGAIDGCHIAVSPLREGSADYIKRKMFPSIVLQGVVNRQYRYVQLGYTMPFMTKYKQICHFSNRFMNINVTTPGSSHDAAVLRQSRLFLMADEILPVVRRKNSSATVFISTLCRLTHFNFRVQLK